MATTTTTKPPPPAWLRRDTGLSKEERLRRMLEKEQQIISKINNSNDDTSHKTNAVPTPVHESDDALTFKVAETRWKKTKDGRWSTRAPVAHGTTFLRTDSSNESHCYKSLSSANYLPVQLLEDLKITDAIERDDDFLVACELLTLICSKYWTSCSQSSTQALLFQHFAHLHRRLKESSFTRVEWREAVKTAMMTMESEIEKEIKLWKLEGDNKPQPKLTLVRLSTIQEYSQDIQHLIGGQLPPLDDGSDNQQVSEATTIQDLPREIIWKILHYLSSDYRAVANAAQVCSLWNSIMQDDAVYFSLVLENNLLSLTSTMTRMATGTASSTFQRISPPPAPHTTWKQFFTTHLRKFPGHGLGYCIECHRIFWFGEFPLSTRVSQSSIPASCVINADFHHPVYRPYYYDPDYHPHNQSTSDGDEKPGFHKLPIPVSPSYVLELFAKNREQRVIV